MKMQLSLKSWLAPVVAALGLSTVALPAQADKRFLQSSTEVAQVLAVGTFHIELDFANGTVPFRGEIEPGYSKEEIEDRVIAVDVTSQTLTLANLGKLNVASAYKFKRNDIRTDGAAWLAGVQASLASNQPVWVEAEGRFVGDRFEAYEVESDLTGKVQLQANIQASNYQAATHTLTIGTLSFNLQNTSLVFKR